MSVISVLLDALGIDAEEVRWQQFANCQDQPLELFYEAYESNERVAKNVDSMCASCPVRRQCLEEGVENSEWGVWGGVFLSNGKADDKRNTHKSPEDWAEITGLMNV